MAKELLAVGAAIGAAIGLGVFVLQRVSADAAARSLPPELRQDPVLEHPPIIESGEDAVGTAGAGTFSMGNISMQRVSFLQMELRTQVMYQGTGLMVTDNSVPVGPSVYLRARLMRDPDGTRFDMPYNSFSSQWRSLIPGMPATLTIQLQPEVALLAGGFPADPAGVYVYRLEVWEFVSRFSPGLPPEGRFLFSRDVVVTF